MAAVIPHAGSFAQASQVFNTIDWVPTMSSVTKGTGAAEDGWYATLGDLVWFGYKLVFGTSPSFTTSSQVNGTLPVTADVTGLQQCFGSWLYRSNIGSGGTAPLHFSGTLGGFDTGGVSFCLDGAWDGSSPRLRVGHSTPVGAGTAGNLPVTGDATHKVPEANDVLSICGVYRAA